MAYVPEWERLYVALKRVMAADVSEDEAKIVLCNAIARRKIRVGFLVRKAETLVTGKWLSRLIPNHFGLVKGGEAVDIPSPLCPGDFNWELSRPLKPWLALSTDWDRWHFEWIELFAADVPIPTDNAGKSKASARTAAREAAVPADDTQTRDWRAKGRKRGRPPKKHEDTKEAMRRDIREGRKKVADFNAMLGKELADTYNVSRSTANKARTAVLSEFVENSNRDK